MIAETKMNKIHRCADRLYTSIQLKCNFMFTILKDPFLFFFHPISNFSLQSFLELIQPKCDYKMVNKSLKSQSAPRP